MGASAPPPSEYPTAVESSRPTAAGEPRWLTERELDAWRMFSAVLMKLPAAIDAQLQRDASLSMFEYHVLAGLSEAPGRELHMSELAVLANGSLSRLSHVVRRLETRGWVRREPCPHDGRYTNAILTDAGHAKLKAAAPGHVAHVRALVIDALADGDLDRAREISERLLRRIDGGENPCSRHQHPC